MTARKNTRRLIISFVLTRSAMAIKTLVDLNLNNPAHSINLPVCRKAA
jgi:hypothetical protein